MSDEILREIEIELPLGYEDEKGGVHRKVTMRPVKNSDIIAVQQDVTLKDKSGANYAMASSNPIAGMALTGLTSVLFSLLFSRVVLKIGEIEKPSKKVFEDMYQRDFMVLMEAYAKINGLDIEEAKKNPFGTLGS